MLGLDYAGIDVGRDPEGRAVIFEANAAMTVLPPDPGDHYRYRQPAYERIANAIADLVRGPDERAP
jgi:glutathione synthase/RimK-type ligase-like ATP-grasp enzyme